MAASKPKATTKRPRARHSVTVDLRRLSRSRLAELGAEYPEHDYWRPRVRGDCKDGPRPCPFVGCRYHLFLDVKASGNLVLNFPEQEPDELVETCALDVADRGGETLRQVGRRLNLTRERIRQVLETVIARLHDDRAIEDVRRAVDDDRSAASARRYLPVVRDADEDDDPDDEQGGPG